MRHDVEFQPADFLLKSTSTRGLQSEWTLAIDSKLRCDPLCSLKNIPWLFIYSIHIVLYFDILYDDIV